jgi:pimeloyl-ACP methyl ester carboxylesterase
LNLIFLHGSGCTRSVWHQQLSYFKGSIALDLPGRPYGEALDNVNDLAEWLITYINNNELTNIVLIGHSLGSAVAMQAALLGRSDIKGLVVIGGGARLKVIPQLLQSLSVLVENADDIPDSFLFANRQIPEPFKTKINLAIKETGAQVMFNDFNACDKFDVMNQLADINIPVQIMVGEKDVMTPVKYASFLQDHLFNSELEIISAGTHMVFAEQAALVNQKIEEFITRAI